MKVLLITALVAAFAVSEADGHPFEWPLADGWNLVTSYVAGADGEALADWGVLYRDGEACSRTIVARYDGVWSMAGSDWPSWANDSFTVDGGEAIWVYCDAE